MEYMTKFKPSLSASADGLTGYSVSGGWFSYDGDRPEIAESLCLKRRGNGRRQQHKHSNPSQFHVTGPFSLVRACCSGGRLCVPEPDNAAMDRQDPVRTKTQFRDVLHKIRSEREHDRRRVGRRGGRIRSRWIRWIVKIRFDNETFAWKVDHQHGVRMSTPGNVMDLKCSGGVLQNTLVADGFDHRRFRVSA